MSTLYVLLVYKDIMKKTNSAGISSLIILLLVLVVVVGGAAIYGLSNNKSSSMQGSNSNEAIAGVETTSASQHQIVIKEIYVQPHENSNGKLTGTYDIYVTAGNLGGAIGGKRLPYTVQLKVGTKVYSKSGWYMPSGVEEMASAGFKDIPIPQLPVSVFAFVDSKNTVKETNENDNKKTISFAGLPDLILENTTGRFVPDSDGTMVSVSGTIKNIGRGPAVLRAVDEDMDVEIPIQIRFYGQSDTTNAISIDCNGLYDDGIKGLGADLTVHPGQSITFVDKYLGSRSDEPAATGTLTINTEAGLTSAYGTCGRASLLVREMDLTNNSQSFTITN